METKNKEFKNEGASAYLVVNRSTRVAILCNLIAHKPEKGFGTNLMKSIISYADFHNYKLVLHAQRFHYRNSLGLNNDQLADFYSKFGFTKTESSPRQGGYMMERERRNPYGKEH